MSKQTSYEKIRKAIARRAREKGMSLDELEDGIDGNTRPDKRGDGRIVRKRIEDEGEGLYDY